MANFSTHTLYKEFGADITGVGECYDPVTDIKVVAAIKLIWHGAPHPLRNDTQVMVFIHKPGEPPDLLPDDLVLEQYKGEGVACCVGKAGNLELAVNGHSTNPADKQADGSRLTAIETATIPGVFVR
jgi:hypothetical protein